METEPFFTTDIFLGIISLYPITLHVVIGFVILILLLIASAMISGSEVAYFSLRPADLQQINDSKKKQHKTIRNMLDNPEKLLATILVANNFVNVGIVILSTYIAHNLVDFSQSRILGFIIEVVLITFILLLFGEILPKIYAGHRSLSFATFMARPLRIAWNLFAPLTGILVHSTSFVNKRMARTRQNLSLDKISQALEMTSKEELSEEKGILEGIVKFGSTSVYQVMTPRIDLFAIENDESPERLLNLIPQSGYSRIPVYEGNIDNIIGILYVKDLIAHIKKMEAFRWQSLIRPPYFVPENKKIDDLLLEFQKSKVHLAIVVDEYGGTSGIVTLEDILEEIVGDIVDEFDDDDVLFTKINENTYLFDGKIQMNDFYRICEINDDYFADIKGEADTLAGLLLEMKNDFPKLNEKLSFRHIDFIVESLDKRRIKKIKVVFNNPAG
ncbi:MAG TPA: gliding motility-associated protein GldE [Prolixibacteraceae bacterium]|nr:gliding motility-associated protein GldE [Prolixibacteraceae bacterium]